MIGHIQKKPLFVWFAGIWGRWRTFSVNSGRQCLYHWRTKVRTLSHTPQCNAAATLLKSLLRSWLVCRGSNQHRRLTWQRSVCVLVPRWQQFAEPDSLPTGPTEEEAVLWALLPGYQLRAPPSWVGGAGNKDTITHCPSPLVSPTNLLLPFSNKLSLSLFFKGCPFYNFIL